jgi:hypothetical protein
MTASLQVLKILLSAVTAHLPIMAQVYKRELSEWMGSSVLVDMARWRHASPWRLQTVLRLALLLDWGFLFGHLMGTLCPERKIYRYGGYRYIAALSSGVRPSSGIASESALRPVLFCKIGCFVYKKPIKFLSASQETAFIFSGDSCLIIMLITNIPFLTGLYLKEKKGS